MERASRELPTHVGAVLDDALSLSALPARLAPIEGRLLWLTSWGVSSTASRAAGLTAYDAPLNRLVVMLGLARIREFVLLLHLEDLAHRARHYRAATRRVVEHARASWVAARVHPNLPSWGPLAALLHDVGLIDGYLDLEHLRAPKDGPLPAREVADVLMAHHAAHGAELLDAWGVPAVVCEYVAQHHRTPRTRAEEALKAARTAAGNLGRGALRFRGSQRPTT